MSQIAPINKTTKLSWHNEKQTFNTKALFTIKYKTEKKIVQKDAVWSINWKGLNESTKLLDISVNSFRQAIRQNLSPLFTEITEDRVTSLTLILLNSAALSCVRDKLR